MSLKTSRGEALAFAKLCNKCFARLAQKTITIHDVTLAFEMAEEICGYRPVDLNETLRVLAKDEARKEYKELVI